MSSNRIFVGNLPLGIRRDELESLFGRYGQLLRCDLREGVRGGYAFIDFISKREADEAVFGLDGFDFDGLKLKVEFYDADNRRRRGMRASDGSGGMRRDFDRDEFDGRYATREERRIGRGEFRVLVTNVPYSASWQDLKDHMREAGDIVFADISGNGIGTVEFGNYESMQNAIKRLDETKMKSRQGDISYIRVKADRGGFGDSIVAKRNNQSVNDGRRNPRPDFDRRDRRLMSRSPIRPYTGGRMRSGIGRSPPQRRGGYGGGGGYV